MTRSENIRSSLEWPQGRLAEFLGLDQSGVSRMEKDGRETGPVSRLLDLLEAGISQGVVTPGMSSAEAWAALFPKPDQESV